MPAFELYQPASIDDAMQAARQARRRRAGAGRRPRQHGLAEGSPQASRRWSSTSGQIKELRGIKEANGGLEIGAMTPLTEVVKHPVVREKFSLLMEAAGAGRLAADPQPGHARRQRVAGHALLVLPRRLDLLPRRRQHLLRRHADGGQPRARDLRRRPLRRGQPVGHRAGAGRARRVDGHPRTEGRARRRRRGVLDRPRASTSRA